MKRRTARSGDRDLGLQGTLFVLGKGGVGKSVVSAGLAAITAAMGRNTLLVRIGESLTESSPTSVSPVPSKHGFEVVDMDARVAMDQYVQNVVRLRPLVERITGSEIYRKFFAAAPGLPELVLLGRIRAYSQDLDRRGANRWATIIVDCPSSGHGLLMLETPFAAFRAASIGPFGRLAAQIMDWLKTETRVALLATPEEMAVVEAIEFQEELRERTGILPSLAFLNRMHRETLSPAARLALLEVEAPADSNDRILLDCAHQAQRRSRIEAFHHHRFARGLGLTPVVVPELPSCGPKAVAKGLLDQLT